MQCSFSIYGIMMGQKQKSENLKYVIYLEAIT